jgi:2,3,4,5-tetrahydropyridine-2,6-dicarboxylate N-succinyltransferase
MASIDAKSLRTQAPERISAAFADRTLLKQASVHEAIVFALREIEAGRLRVATTAASEHGPWVDPHAARMVMDGDLREWQVHAWVKQAILLALAWRTPKLLGGFDEQELKVTKSSADQDQGRVHRDRMVFFDKLDTRSDLAEAGVRVVPPGVVREGAYVARGCIIMPGYVNIGAYVGEGTMVDTWATVGSCAQIGARVHLAGGVGIGGVLEPPGARPVMVGDDAFIGSRCIVVEGAVVSARAILGAGVCLTATTPVYDVTTSERQEFRGFVPAGAIVAPGTREKDFPGGRVALNCGYIIGYRNEGTDARVAINDTLREYGISL